MHQNNNHSDAPGQDHTVERHAMNAGSAAIADTHADSPAAGPGDLLAVPVSETIRAVMDEMLTAVESPRGSSRKGLRLS